MAARVFIELLQLDRWWARPHFCTQRENLQGAEGISNIAAHQSL